MTQSLFKPGRTTSTPLPGLPRPALSPAEQVEALKRVQSQAEQRVHLGVQLFKAAEAQTAQHRQVLNEFKQQQTAFRDEMEEDVTRSLHAYDAWIGQIDQDLSNSIKSLEEKIARLQQDWQGTQTRIEGMVERSEKLLAHTRDLVDSGRFVPGAAARPAPTLADGITAVPASAAAEPTPESPPAPALDDATATATPPALPPNFYTELIDRLDQEPKD